MIWYAIEKQILICVSLQRIWTNNAKSLFENAKQISANKSFGIATSLLILSVEEVVKGMVSMSGYFNIDVPFDTAPIFRQHRDKHIRAADMQSFMRNISMKMTMEVDILNEKTVSIKSITSEVVMLASLVVSELLQGKEKKKK